MALAKPTEKGRPNLVPGLLPAIHEQPLEDELLWNEADEDELLPLEDEHLWDKPDELDVEPEDARNTMSATRVLPKVKIHLPRPLLPKGKAEKFFATRKRPLAPEDQDIVAWLPENAGRVYMVEDGNTVRGSSIQTLKDAVWLDDSVFNDVASIVNSAQGHVSSRHFLCFHFTL